MVRNYFKPNSAQNKCNYVGVTADGLEIWTVDDGEMLAVKHDDMLYRIAHKEHLESLKKMQLIERINIVVNHNFQNVTAEGSKAMRIGCGPSEFEIVGRLQDWYKCREIIDARIEVDRKSKLEKETQEMIKIEKLYQESLDTASDDFKNGKMITAEMFEGLLVRHGISVAPKTMGWIRRGLSQISRYQYSYDGRFNKSTTVMTYANKLIEILTKN